MFLNMKNYIAGSVDIEAKSPYPERFVNICAKGGIGLWNCRRESADTIRASMRIDDFCKLRHLAKKAFCKVHIIKKHGMPLLWWKLRGRVVLLCGALLLCGLLIAASMFVWDVQITGVQTIDPAELTELLRSVGVRPGAYIGNIDESDVQNSMLLADDRLKWIAVNIRGSRAYVAIREQEPQPKIIDLNTPTDVIAARTGIITSMEVTMGTAKVKVGQTVLKGDLLVSGTVTDANGIVRNVHAAANVRGRIWYTLDGVLPLTRYRKDYTGREIVRHTVAFGKRMVKIYYNSSISYDNYDKIIKKKQYMLSVSVITETIREYKLVPNNLAQAEARALLEQSLRAQAVQLSDGTVSSSNIRFTDEKGFLHAVLECECAGPLDKEVVQGP